MNLIKQFKGETWEIISRVYHNNQCFLLMTNSSGEKLKRTVPISHYLAR